MRRVTGVLAALLLGSAAGVVAASGPAAAAACATGQGVTVVVGSKVSCDADGGSPASGNFKDAGHSLTMVDRQPGFVCRVDGVPAAASCVNTPPGDAYWGLFWSNGTSGTWTYASQGAGSLKVPAGGWVAFVFQNGGAKTYPGVDPVSAASAPAASAKPAAKPKAQPTPKAPTRPSVTPGATARPGAKATTPSTAPTSARPTPTPGTTPTASATPSATAPAPAASPTAEAAPGDEADSTEPVERTSAETADGVSGPLGWVAVALVIALLGGMGGVLWRRKAASGPS
jgi:hypothetical protein